MEIIKSLKGELGKGHISYWILIIVMIILPLYYWYLPPLIILLAIVWLLENYLGAVELFREKSKYKILLFFFMSLYLWQVAGLLYSSDLRLGFSNVFGRLFFLVLPLILFKPGKIILNKTRLLLKVFAVSTLIYIVICFGYALIRSLSLSNGILVFNPHPPEYEWDNYFFGPYFAFSIHPSYLAMFVLISAVIAFESRNESALRFPVKLFWITTGIILLLSLLFLASRAGILAAIALIFTYSIVNAFRPGRIRYFWIGVLLIMLLLLPVFRKNEHVVYILNSISSLVQKNPGSEIKDDRIIAWQSSLNIIKKHVITGVGIGDVRTELVKEYDLIKAEHLSNQRLNAHNQFLEILIENGLIGFLLFLGIFCSMSYIAISERNLMYGLFILMMLVFFTFETVLYRLAGIVFFSLFSFLLLHTNQKNIS